MYARILIHVDRASAFETYVPFLRDVLRRNITREAVVTTAVEPCAPTLYGYVLDPAVVAATDAANLAEAKGLLSRIANELDTAGARLSTEVLMGDPVETFRAYAARGAFDLVVIAPTGGRYLLTGKPRAFRRALRRVAKPVMILQAIPAPA
jgi:nucleotide-binding universal stress UspA family protein